jgi:hypothetical protein
MLILIISLALIGFHINNSSNQPKSTSRQPRSITNPVLEKKEIGINFNELSAAIAVLGRVIKPELSFIAFKQAITDLITPSEQAKVAFEKYGITVNKEVLRIKGLGAVLQLKWSVSGVQPAKMRLAFVPTKRWPAG